MQIAQTTGLYGIIHFGSIATHRNDQDEIIDLEINTHRLTCLSDACAGMNAVHTMQNLFLDAIRCLNHDIDQARDMQENNGNTVLSGSH